MISMAKMISIISDFSPKELQLLADGLVWFEQAQAERLRNAIIVAQQEHDQSYMAQWEQERQYQMMSIQEDNERG